MIERRNKFIFRTAHILFDDECALRTLSENKYGKITFVSYNSSVTNKCEVLQKTTAVIELSLGTEELFRRFSDTTRNEIRRSYKINNLAFGMSQHGGKDAYNLYKNFERSQHRIPISYALFQSSRIFYAKYNGVLVSAITISEAAPILRVRSIFSARLQSKDAEQKKIISYSTRRLMWEICQWGAQNYFTLLDLASVNTENPRTKSIAAFKMSFGGTKRMEYTYICKTPLFRFFEFFVFIPLLIRRITGRLTN